MLFSRSIHAFKNKFKQISKKVESKYSFWESNRWKGAFLIVIKQIDLVELAKDEDEEATPCRKRQFL